MPFVRPAVIAPVAPPSSAAVRLNWPVLACEIALALNPPTPAEIIEPPTVVAITPGISALAAPAVMNDATTAVTAIPICSNRPGLSASDLKLVCRLSLTVLCVKFPPSWLLRDGFKKAPWGC